jgi:hypothetical protein
VGLPFADLVHADPRFAGQPQARIILAKIVAGLADWSDSAQGVAALECAGGRDGELRRDGREAWRVAAGDEYDFGAMLASGFPARSGDVVHAVLALQPEWRGSWERARRAAPERAELAAYPAFPELALDPNPDPPPGGASA